MIKRFKKVYNELVERKLIIKSSRTENKRSFAEKIFGQKLTHVLDRCLGLSKIKGYVSPTMVENLYKHYDVNRDYMYYGKKPIFVPKKIERQLNIQNELKISEGLANKIVYMPNIPVAASFSNLTDKLMQEQDVFKIPGFEGNMNAFKVEGNSMNPKFKSGDMVLCDDIDSAIIDNETYVVFLGNAAMLKKVKVAKSNNGVKRYKLISNNHKEHKPFFISAEEGLRFFKVRHRISPV